MAKIPSRSLTTILCLSIMVFARTSSAQSDTENFIAKLNQLGPEGKNHPALIEAASDLRGADAQAGIELLQAINDQNPLQANWLRLTAESIFQNHPPELSELRSIVTGEANSSLSRVAAFDLLRDYDAVQANALVPSFRKDSCQALRRINIQQTLDAIENSQLPPAEKQSQLRSLLQDARDIDQIDQIIRQLKDSQSPVDRNQWLGFVQDWQVIGPFDNTDGKGFAAVYPIEQNAGSPQFNKTWPGKLGEVAWQEISSTDSNGFVDINALLEKHNGAVVYLATNILADKPRDVQLRLGTYNAIKAWVNGELLIQRNVYHTNEMVDQFVADVQLKKGDNWIVLKLCQNEQKESWAQNWRFLCRVTDGSGLSITNEAAE